MSKRVRAMGEALAQRKMSCLHITIDQSSECVCIAYGKDKKMRFLIKLKFWISSIESIYFGGPI